MQANTPSPLAVDYVEAGRLCGLCSETIARAVRRGELPAAQIGRSRRVLVADLEAWLRTKAAESAASGGAT